MPPVKTIPQARLERDALHLLPLSIVPFETKAFRGAWLIKSIGLDSMVEVFNDSETGSGQIEPSQVKRYLPAGSEASKADVALLAHLSLMQSFDVYTLRIHLRQRGFDVDAIPHLKLSDARRQELDQFMVHFTRPLGEELVGPERAAEIPASHLLRVAFDGGDPELARNIRRFAKRLDLILQKLPAFIESYGDVFLSIAYFEHEYESIRAALQKFLGSLRRTGAELKKNDRLDSIAMLERVEKAFVFAARNVEERIKRCHVSADALWRDLSLEKFERTRLDVESNHIALGALLCGLSVKMHGWNAADGDNCGNPLRYAELVHEIMSPGLESMLRFEMTTQVNTRRRQENYNG